MTIEEDQQLSNSEYWDSRYVTSNGDDPTHEWFRSFDHLLPFLSKNLLEQPGRTAQDNPKILHLGSGDSVVPAELAGRGYKDQLCVDFSPVVVDLMTERHKDIPGIEWQRVDVRDMPSVTTGSIDVAFDKGTLDAMIYGSPWSPPDEVKDNTSKYLKEVHRAMKDDGVFLYITFRQPHFMKLLLNPDNIWDMEMEVLGGGGMLDYYGYVIRKSKPQ
ncbi:endothelin-converting enzyme 2 [Fusarium flagelliforme]|uniref:Endothelin-converting enzyme 2 n=1 Tax=Fusarium flagelliforme TaxID=2675880 RepID=A0A395MZF1_9HYPO|nr:endothelin-converting enzyme 2 [Fusarium flagelliforme]